MSIKSLSPNKIVIIMSSKADILQIFEIPREFESLNQVSAEVIFLSCLEKPKTIRKIGQEWGYSNPAVSLGKDTKLIEDMLGNQLLEIVFQEDRNLDGMESNIKYYQVNMEGLLKIYEKGNLDPDFIQDKDIWLKIWSDKKIRSVLFKTSAIKLFTISRKNLNIVCFSIPYLLTNFFILMGVLSIGIESDKHKLSGYANQFEGSIIPLSDQGLPLLSLQNLIEGFTNDEFKFLLNIFNNSEVRKSKTYQKVIKEISPKIKEYLKYQRLKLEETEKFFS